MTGIRARQPLADHAHHDVVGHQMAFVHHLLRDLAKMAALEHRFAEDVPRRNLQNMVLSREPGRLRSLAGSWRSEHDHVQRHPALSDGLV